jgi:broad specificity phosphatase PhoE
MVSTSFGTFKGLCGAAVFMLCTHSLQAQNAPPTSAGPALVVLVRHAEKAATPADDPPLTEAGAARARALEHALHSMGVTAIITSEFRRTRDTAEPLARSRGLTPEVVQAGGAAAAGHVQAVAAAVRRHSSGVILVVGHSNTIPAIIAALGGERMRDICDGDYDSMFVLSPGANRSSLMRMHFGADDKSDAPGSPCAVMR